MFMETSQNSYRISDFVEETVKNNRRRILRQDNSTTSSKVHKHQVLDLETETKLRAYLSPEFTFSQSWDRLVSALKRKGYSLVRDQNGTVLLRSWPTGATICEPERLGFSMIALKGRMGGFS